MALSARRLSGKQLARLLGALASDLPQYLALAASVRELLLAGHVPLAVRLPAERELALALNVSRTTITAAYDRLRAEGYVESRPGSGSFTTTPGPGKRGGPWPRADEGQIDFSMAAPPATRLLPEALAAATRELPCYTGASGYWPAGLPVLRAAIAQHYQTLGVATTPEQILVTAGSQHALSLLFHELLSRGDAVLVESPTYPHAMTAARHAGGRLVPIGLHPKTGWDLELIEQTFRQAGVRVAYMIADFQNPTGLSMNAATRRELVAAARRAGLHLLVDETYFGFNFGSGHMAPPVASFDSDGRVVSIGGLSKIAWGGLRIGWIRAAPGLIERLTVARAACDMASPILEQLIALQLLARHDELVAESRRFVAQRDALVTALRKLEPEWHFEVPRGGLSLWIELEAPISSQLVTAAARYGVHLVPGSYFSADGLLERYLRLPFVLPAPLLEEGVNRIAQAHRKLRGPAVETLLAGYRAVV